MPGHIKLGSSGEPDPDPMPYLVVSQDMRRADLNKPYDPKKSVWVPAPEGGFVEALLDSEAGGKTTVMVGHEKKVFKSELVGQVNPPKFEKCDDMANLTYLNDASVFWNLKTRFQAKLIYTYSGLFCVVVNPYKRFPIYTPSVVKVYLGKRRNEVPPHLWAITETAYRNMLQNTKDQSMLITGESGAGKTENTKKVISYLAMVASSGKKSNKKVSLEDQIVATNPILESYGNAKTSRNDNSSRFGKFIRIHFTTTGKLAGCDIESYLLEKSRITQQQEVERSYHIFYQLLMPFVPDMKNKCELSDDIYDYSYVSQGKTTVASIDDNEEMEYTDNAFDILGFSEPEKWDCYKLTAAVMAMGEIKFKQKGRDEQCEPDGLEWATKVAILAGVDPEALLKAFVKPRIKVGTEWVTKGQNIDQSTNAVGGIARGIYDRIFKWLIVKCNETLIDPTMKKSHFVAVLDIAGFEIFEYNGFEQISINFVNEKLQQFFNHHMFVVEQEEYISEGIDWAMVDFGMDLAACIIMFEKPMGIWAILEEESLFPKATDKSFEDKLKAQHLGKSPPFAKPQSKTDKNAHFAIVHYAGIVSYNVTAWLEKNKDPVNDTVVDLLKKGSNELLVLLWQDHPGQTAPPPADDGKGGKKKKKGGGAKTVSSVYLVQLQSLMGTLHNTEPHFIRCIVPNTHKQPGAVEPPLIMHQLTCNGVLEGIRICMRGFPNRILYPDFRQRYQVLGGAKSGTEKDIKKCAQIILESTEGFEAEKYRLGHTKVFFRAGSLALLEEKRDEIVTALIRKIQGGCYGYIKRKDFAKKKAKRDYITVIQRNLRKYKTHRDWPWFMIIQKTRPLIGVINVEEELRVLEEKATSAYGAYQEQLHTKAMLEEENNVLSRELEGLRSTIKTEQGDLGSYQEKMAKFSTQKADLEIQLENNRQKLEHEERIRQQSSEDKRNAEREVGGVKQEVGEVQSKLERATQDKNKLDQILRSLNDEVVHQDEVLSKLNKEKRHLSDSMSKFTDELATNEDKYAHLNDVKAKLEKTLDQMDGALENEKRLKTNVEKERRRLEGELKIAQESVLDLERGKRELEQSILRKDTEIHQMITTLDDEQAGMNRIQKNIKELQSRVEELEEELEAERQGRAKAERQRQDLARELDELAERLEESCHATAAQIELNKKREHEIMKLRKDVEEINIQHEATLISLRKKHQDAVVEMSEQIDQLNKLKARIEKDKCTVRMQLDDTRAATDHVNHEKSVAEKNLKALDAQLQQLQRKIDDHVAALVDYENQNKRLTSENSNLFTRLEELMGNASILQKLRIQLASQLDDAKRNCDEEAKERQSLLGRFRTLEHEYDGVKCHCDDEIQQKDEVARQLAKASDECNLWRTRYEHDILLRVEDLEATKIKLQARLAESESTMESLNGRLISLEKAKDATAKEIEELAMRVDQATVLYNQAERKIKMMDAAIAEWKSKADNASMDLNNSQKECRNASAELFRVKNGYEEAAMQLDGVKRENHSLSDEIKDLMEQISEGGRSIHEIEKQRKKLEADKFELEAALSDAEGALEQEENKLLRLNLEVNQVRADIEKRIQEKEEEFEGTKRNHTKQLEQMQYNIESELKAKAEAMRMRKKLELDVNELESSLEHANLANMELQKNIKGYQDKIKEKTCQYEDEQRAKDMARDMMLAAERRAGSMQNGLEEAKTMLDQADRARKQSEQELSDTNESLADLTVQNQSLNSAKRKLDQDLGDFRGEADEAASDAMMTEDKAKKTMMDAAKIAEELRYEQELAQMLEKERKDLEARAHEIQIQVDDAEQNAVKWGRKMVAKLESRVKELESEMDTEQRRLGDATKNFRKADRGIKEYTFRQEEDRKNAERMQELVDKLQNQVRNYKKQIEEAEEIAALNLAKYRKAQVELQESLERADLSEQAWAKLRARGRSASIARDF
eukprot:maker-scaffold603_size126491-snap-gene-0.28 protein:Tk03885 transcript:maker-scaffold603_size126491-snap-gene-0.28-mRNA-1 annotation:"myosin heavy muscle isoform x19"